MQYIDLRSDTVTHPTSQMREAIFNAEVGDDYYGDDPTVNLLEKEAAQLLGHQAACLVPSGTFGNQCAVKTHSEHAQEIILSNQCHMIQYQNGSIGRISGLLTKTIKTADGRMSYDQVKKAIDARKIKSLLAPKLSMLELQNPTTFGKVYPMQEFVKICELAHQNGLKIHLDGARLFSAAIKLGVQAKQICKHVDSVMFCLSKGLCAPMGSLVVSSKQFIQKFRYNRKMMGGGLRQAGYIAAPGLISIRKMRHQLKQDHEIADLFSKLLSEINWIEMVHHPQVSMFYFKIKAQINFSQLDNFLRHHKIIMSLPKSNDDLVRIITHHYIRQKQVLFTIQKLKQFVERNTSN